MATDNENNDEVSDKDIAPPAPARRRKVVNLRDPAPKDPPPGDDEVELTEEERSMLELQQVLESNDLVGGTCRLERRGPTDTGFAYIGKLKTNQFDLDSIKKVFGGGDYQVQFFRSNGQIARKLAFTIDPRFKGSMDLQSVPGLDYKAGKAEDAASNKIVEMMATAIIADKKTDPAQGRIMETLMKSQQESTQLLMTMMMKSAETQAQMMAGMMTAMATAFGAKQSSAPNGFSTQDLISLMTLLKSGDGAKAPTMLELTQALKNLKEISDNGGGGEEEGPKSTLDKILAIAPHVAETVKTLKGGVPSVPVTSPAPASAGALPAAGATSPAPASTGEPANQSDINAALQLVVSGARRNSEVDLYHDMLMDQITDEQVPMLKEVLTQDSWFSTLFGKLPDAEQLKPWLTKLRDMILETFSQPDTDGQPSNADPAGVRSPENPDRAGQHP